MLRAEKGFTLIELCFAVSICGLVIAHTIPLFINARDSALETEVKNNIHKIQIALERYGTDRNGQYPAMIWGGNRQGWSTEKGIGCRTMWEHESFDGENEDTAVPPFDPLIFYHYFETYPQNPFLRSGDGIKTAIKWTSCKNGQLGDGDVRFGYNGEVMGNIIEDPKYLWKSYGVLSRVKNTFSQGACENKKGMVNHELPANPFYSMGGIPEWPDSPDTVVTVNNPARVSTRNAYWPGEFFYRARGSFDIPLAYKLQKKNMNVPDLQYVWEFPYDKIDSYLVGGFGCMRSRGMDIFRLTDLNGVIIDNKYGATPDCNYMPHPRLWRMENNPVRFSSPEVSGGGAWAQMPIFPAYDPDGMSWIWGAPDGFRDGVIFATSEKTNMILEWSNDKLKKVK